MQETMGKCGGRPTSNSKLKMVIFDIYCNEKVTSIAIGNKIILEAEIAKEWGERTPQNGRG